MQFVRGALLVDDDMLGGQARAALLAKCNRSSINVRFDVDKQNELQEKAMKLKRLRGREPTVQALQSIRKNDYQTLFDSEVIVSASGEQFQKKILAQNGGAVSIRNYGFFTGEEETVENLS
jgi:hypothetical protein